MIVPWLSHDWGFPSRHGGSPIDIPSWYWLLGVAASVFLFVGLNEECRLNGRQWNLMGYSEETLGYTEYIWVRQDHELWTIHVETNIANARPSSCSVRSTKAVILLIRFSGPGPGFLKAIRGISIVFFRGGGLIMNIMAVSPNSAKRNRAGYPFLGGFLKWGYPKKHGLFHGKSCE